MAGKKIIFRRLLLQGFGPYYEATEVHFQPGTNNLVTANEKGKSTLVAGLTAIIFGLPASGDPAKYGLACYRNWEDPPSCRGELEFTVDGERFAIERDFDSNRICLAKLGPGGEVQMILAEGTHNPNAKRPHPDYARKIKEIFGLLSRELFISTFCVTQPLPELKGLSREVQKLLSGGGVDFAGVLKSLEDELKEWTKYTGDLGVTSRNQLKERELELLEEKMAALQDRLEEDRQAVDSLEKVQKKLQEVEERSTQVQQDWRSKKKVLEAWSEWKRLQGNYQSAWRDYNRLLRACEESAKIQAEADTAQEQLSREYPELARSGEETGRHLEELTIWEEKKNSCRGDLEQQDRHRQKKEAEKTGLEEKLADFPRWKELGADPRGQVKIARKNAEACLQEWSSFQEKLRKIADLDSLLSGEYALLEQARPEEREAVKNYVKINAGLEKIESEAGEKLERARTQLENQARARRALEEKYRDFVPEISDDALADEGIGQKSDAAKQKLAALERESLLVEKKAVFKKNLHPPAVLRLLLAAILAAVFALAAGGAFPTGGSFPVQVFAVLAGGLAGYGGAGLLFGLWRIQDKRGLQAAARELAACREEIETLNDPLGDYAAAGPAQLGALLEKIKQFHEEKAAWETLKNRLPDAAQLAALEADFEQAATSYRGFLAMMEKFTAAYPDVEEAYGRWQSLLEERKRKWREAETFAAETFGCSVQQAPGADPQAGKTMALWRDTVFLLKIFFPQEAYTTVSDLLTFLEKTDAPEWEKIEIKARRYSAIVNGIQKLTTELGAAALPVRELKERLSGLQKESDKLSAGLQEILTGAAGDLRTARKRWDACQSIRRELGLKNAALEAALNQYGAATLEKLKDKKSEAELHVREHLSKWGAHIEKYPGLPQIEESENVGDIIKNMEELAGEVRTLEEHSIKLQKEWEKIRMRQLQLQGRDLINIARAEIELLELQKKKEDIELLRDAIAVAHIELTAAIAGYQDSYLQYLEEKATAYYRQITRNETRRLTFSPDFQLQVMEGGRPCEIAQLSKGAQDQLYLALRFAVADLLAENYKLPFIFDDPFVSSDHERLENIREILERAAVERQFAVLSHNEVFSDWGTPLKTTPL